MSKDRESKTKQESYEKSHQSSLILEDRYRKNSENVSKRIIEEVEKSI